MLGLNKNIILWKLRDNLVQKIDCNGKATAFIVYGKLWEVSCLFL